MHFDLFARASFVSQRFYIFYTFFTIPAMCTTDLNVSCHMNALFVKKEKQPESL